MKTQSQAKDAGLRNRAEQSGSGEGSNRLPLNPAQRLRNRTLPTEALLKLLASQATAQLSVKESWAGFVQLAAFARKYSALLEPVLKG